MSIKYYRRWLIAVCLLIALACLIAPLSAQDATGDTGPAQQVPSKENIVKKNCMVCHSQKGLVEQGAEGVLKAITIDETLFDASVHGSFDCTMCHSEFNSGFHGDPKLPDDVELEFKRVFAGKSKSSHQALYACTKCHPDEAAEYRTSIHGKALYEEGISDAPYCIDCHGKHYIKKKNDPTSATYTPNAPLVCAGCHSDEALMLRYNLDTGAFRGYYESYHGKKQELGGNSKVPVCTTCHTAHSIKAPEDPGSSVYGEAGAQTCGKCHTGADESFLMAFTHKPPTQESSPVVYFVRWIYSWILTTVVLGMAFYISLDLFAQIRLRLRARKGGVR